MKYESIFDAISAGDYDETLRLAAAQSDKIFYDDDSNEMNDVNGIKPLAYAIKCFGEGKLSDMDIIGVLLSEGADIDGGNKTEPPIVLAASFGLSEVVESLAGFGANVNAKDALGETALHKSVARADVEMTAVLLNCGGDLEAANNDGETPIDKYPEGAEMKIEDFSDAVEKFLADRLAQYRQMREMSHYRGY